MGRSGPPSRTWFYGPTRVHSPNGISIGSAIFARLKIVTDRQTDRQPDHASPVYNNRVHLHSSKMRSNDNLCSVVATDGTNQWHNINEIYNVHVYQSTNFLNVTVSVHCLSLCLSAEFHKKCCVDFHEIQETGSVWKRELSMRCWIMSAKWWFFAPFLS